MELTSLVDAEKILTKAQKKLNEFNRDFYDDVTEADQKKEKLHSKVIKAKETVEKLKKLPIKSNNIDRDDH